eukprot:TRINITY_DN8614_c0_g2_i2.p1 TRINITY_DN8614_c0_g2~~TRINITY_DN8614_c0_g2_i2.p1  ORF type:complete len:162 (+),score=17.10 TRINITY_DN8614_c0_g2_i2:196-681(+)
MALLERNRLSDSADIGITIIDATNAKSLDSNLQVLIDRLGVESASAQSLPQPITSVSKLKYSDHRLYLLSQENNGRRQVLGLLKTGTKKLFLTDQYHRWHERQCPCVLDFYVVAAHQRRGYGKQLLDSACKASSMFIKHGVALHYVSSHVVGAIVPPRLCL